MIMNPVAEAIEIQKRYGYSDQQMADLLGCSRVLYQRTRTGKIEAGGAFLKGMLRLLSPEANRSSVLERETGETHIRLQLGIDGTGKHEVDTSIKMLDHLLSQVAQHGRFDLDITASGDDPHHLAEDIAICLGKALGDALGEKRGIIRIADTSVPMDEALAMVAIDISGRGYSVLDLAFSENDMQGFSTDLIRHFLESFAIEARLNLHARITCGTNDHHKAEALFKALGKVLDNATRIDERLGGTVPSTKDYLEK
jgi:imidazoleglycerol-phosphate dehydratase